MNLKNSILVLLLVAMSACGTSKSSSSDATSLNETLEQKNRMSISLLDQIRRLPGVTLRGGVPVFNKNNNTLVAGGNSEPLYILDGYIVGNSFRSVNQLVQNIEVAKIEAITGPDASFYGTRGASGVIKISTIK